MTIDMHTWADDMLGTKIFFYIYMLIYVRTFMQLIKDFSVIPKSHHHHLKA